jgi:hypothetical protein
MGGFLSGGLCPGGFCPVPSNYILKNAENKEKADKADRLQVSSVSAMFLAGIRIQKNILNS